MFRALNGPELPQNFTEIFLYETEFIKLTHIPNDLDFIIFTSASTVRSFVNSCDKMRNAEDRSAAKIICIGRQTAEQAERSGFTDIKISKRATVEEIFNSVLENSPRLKS